MPHEEVKCKIVLLGESFVGKTKLVETFSNGYYTKTVPRASISLAFVQEHITSNNQDVLLEIWDTAGQERFRAMNRSYYREANAAIVCYDVTKKSSFVEAKHWVQQLLENEEKCKIYLTGTKLDLVECGYETKKVNVFEATSYAEEYYTTLIETSSKNNYNVYKVFQTIADDFTARLRNATNLQQDPSQMSFKLEPPPSEESWWTRQWKRIC